MSDPVISIKDFSFSYPDGTKALSKVNLEINEGEFVVVMGPNGAGKTTLCLSFNGAVPNISTGDMYGSVKVFGMDTVEHRTYDLASKVGMVLQDPEAQLFCHDVFSEVAFGPENLGLEKEDILDRIKWALKATRISGMDEREPSSLSGGQKQRLAIAAIMAMRPEILVLDEPTSQLDPIGTQEVFSVVKDLNKKYNTTVIMAEHKSELIAEFADKIVLMDKGQIVAEGPPHEIFQKEKLLDSIFVKMPEVSHLGIELMKKGYLSKVPVTLQEAEKVIDKLIIGGKIKPKSVKKVDEEKPKDAVPILETIGLSHTYPGDIRALDNINLKINRGDFVGFIGQNGAGKTTLIKHFIGLLKPTKGQVLLEGEDTVDMRIPELAKKIGVVLQNPDHQIFSPTVKEEVAFAPTIAQLDEEEIEGRTNRAIKAMGLEDYVDQYPFSMSMGIRRKITVASILAMEPEILIFDEPTTGQDYKGRYEIGEIAKRLNEEGRTIIMITHDMELVARYAKRVVAFGTASVLLDGLTDHVFSQIDTLKKTFLAPPQITMLANKLTKHGYPSNILNVEDFLQNTSY